VNTKASRVRASVLSQKLVTRRDVHLLDYRAEFMLMCRRWPVLPATIGYEQTGPRIGKTRRLATRKRLRSSKSAGEGERQTGWSDIDGRERVG
jgi:hypothetical protein